MVTTGIDIIEVKRIKENIEKYNENFLNRVYTKKEIEYCESKKTQKYQSYAARFAGKEAIFKAISHMLENKFTIQWKDIEILNNKQGKPIVFLSEELKKLLQHEINIDISLSHISETAIASCVVSEI